MITLVTSNEEDREIGQCHAVNIVETAAEAIDRGLIVWRNNYTEARKLRKRQWAVGSIKSGNSSTVLGSTVHYVSHHRTIELAITAAKGIAASNDLSIEMAELVRSGLDKTTN